MMFGSIFRPTTRPLRHHLGVSLEKFPSLLHFYSASFQHVILQDDQKSRKDSGKFILFSSVPLRLHEPAYPTDFPVPVSAVLRELQKSSDVQRIMKSFAGGCEASTDDYVVSEGLLYRKTQSGNYTTIWSTGPFQNFQTATRF